MSEPPPRGGGEGYEACADEEQARKLRIENNAAEADQKES